MTDKRKKYTPAEEIYLTTQVSSVCPLCGTALFYTKRNRPYKAYEIAHIYPLNPTPTEVEELDGEKRLHSDSNHPNNLIALCPGCHTRFDKPKAKEEYRELIAIKEALLRHEEQQRIQTQYQIESDISAVIDGLYTENMPTVDVELELDPKHLADKFDNSISRPTQQKIKHNVADYYPQIKAKLVEIERGNPGASDLIFVQVKAYYLKQKSLGLSKQEIFSNIVDWFRATTQPQTIEAAEIVTSFFVQNCEVFE